MFRVRQFNITNISLVPNVIYRFSSNPIKIPASY